MNYADGVRCMRSRLEVRPFGLLPVLCLASLLLSAPVIAQDLKAPPLTPLAQDGIHDPDGEAITTLQEPREAMEDFPTDRRGEVDWVRAINEGYVDPRKTRTDNPWDNALMRSMDFNILMKNTQNMPYVLFPHRQHTQWLTCSNCHFDIFIPREHANPISMIKVLSGQFCGRCHDKVAFALWNCERCHSVPHEDSPPKWW